ncbi:MAG TPA: hypothetical protein VHK06_01365 [Candidatus Limnocylindria bacterium]|nr:hypothetical protein [Candidatus Limnocylindria bacterium]
MQSDRAIGRYRRLYGRLLRLYPRSFRERFGEPMAQTFTDLARERSDANRGLLGFALATFAETSAGIIRENLAHMTTQPMNYLRWVLVTAAVLALPALAMAFNIGVPDPGSGTDGVNWGPMDFATIGVLVLGAGLLFEYASSRGRSVEHRAAVGIAVLAGLGLVWVNLAVGMMDVEPGNSMYVLVLVVALIGAAIGRFEPREASIAMFATAGAHAVVAVIALVTGLGPTLLADAFFVAAWVASGLLFRRASVASVPSR